MGLDGSASSSMGVRRSHRETETTLHMDGELDLTTVPQLRSQFDNLNAGGEHRILLDLAGVTFIDSSGLREILNATAKLAEQGRELRVIEASSQVRRIFEICGVTDLIDEPTPNSAVIPSQRGHDG
jgi:anti-sigma B factor antagonist